MTFRAEEQIEIVNTSSSLTFDCFGRGGPILFYYRGRWLMDEQGVNRLYKNVNGSITYDGLLSSESGILNVPLAPRLPSGLYHLSSNSKTRSMAKIQ